MLNEKLVYGYLRNGLKTVNSAIYEIIEAVEKPLAGEDEEGNKIANALDKARQFIKKADWILNCVSLDRLDKVDEVEA